MSETTKNMEKIIGIEGLWFKLHGNHTGLPLVLVSVSAAGWTCLSQEDIDGKGILGFSFMGKLCQVEGEAHTQEGKISVRFFHTLPWEVERAVQDWIKLNRSSERRRGERYEVGLRDNKWKAFGLKSQKQRLIFNGSNIDCVLSNVSFHGALVTAEAIPSLVVGRQMVYLEIHFCSPAELLLLPAIVVRVDRPIPKLAQYALSFVEMPVSWMRRVDGYAMKLKCD